MIDKIDFATQADIDDYELFWLVHDQIKSLMFMSYKKMSFTNEVFSVFARNSASLGRDSIMSGINFLHGLNQDNDHYGECAATIKKELETLCDTYGYSHRAIADKNNIRMYSESEEYAADDVEEDERR